MKSKQISTAVQPFLSELTNNDKKEFYEDLCRTMVKANIPWRKLDNVYFRNFLQKYTNKIIPNESTLRKNYLSAIYSSVSF